MIFVDHPAYFDREGIYVEGGGDYPDNPRRFALFTRAALEADLDVRERSGACARSRLACIARARLHAVVCRLAREIPRNSAHASRFTMPDIRDTSRHQ